MADSQKQRCLGHWGWSLYITVYQVNLIHLWRFNGFLKIAFGWILPFFPVYISFSRKDWKDPAQNSVSLLFCSVSMQQKSMSHSFYRQECKKVEKGLAAIFYFKVKWVLMKFFKNLTWLLDGKIPSPTCNWLLAPGFCPLHNTPRHKKLKGTMWLCAVWGQQYVMLGDS